MIFTRVPVFLSAFRLPRPKEFLICNETFTIFCGPNLLCLATQDCNLSRFATRFGQDLRVLAIGLARHAQIRAEWKSSLETQGQIVRTTFLRRIFSSPLQTSPRPHYLPRGLRRCANVGVSFSPYVYMAVQVGFRIGFFCMGVKKWSVFCTDDLPCSNIVTVKPPFRGPGTSSGQRKVFPERRCPFIIGSKYKHYRNVLFFRDQSLCPLNGGVPKERFHCILLGSLFGAVTQVCVWKL